MHIDHDLLCTKTRRRTMRRVGGFLHVQYQLYRIQASGASNPGFSPSALVNTLSASRQAVRNTRCSRNKTHPHDRTFRPPQEAIRAEEACELAWAAENCK